MDRNEPRLNLGRGDLKIPSTGRHSRRHHHRASRSRSVATSIGAQMNRLEKIQEQVEFYVSILGSCMQDTDQVQLLLFSSRMRISVEIVILRRN